MEISVFFESSESSQHTECLICHDGLGLLLHELEEVMEDVVDGFPILLVGNHKRIDGESSVSVESCDDSDHVFGFPAFDGNGSFLDQAEGEIKANGPSKPVVEFFHLGSDDHEGVWKGQVFRFKVFRFIVNIAVFLLRELHQFLEVVWHFPCEHFLLFPVDFVFEGPQLLGHDVSEGFKFLVQDDDRLTFTGFM